MKWILKLTALLTVVLLSGCSFLQEVNSTLEYANEAKDYMNEAAAFAEEAPALAEKAAGSVQAREDLKQSLLDMKEEIQTFKEIEAPGAAQDAHSQLIKYSESLESGIDSALQQVENGEYTLQMLEDSEMMRNINEMKQILDQIEQLGS
ncbi:DUF6376 family protein [Metabacillus indicus]|uniref:DUF6376 family protein n=1 Tax=Metabacillus indicus TaxID=246786 RepID=UPI00316BEE05